MPYEENIKDLLISYFRDVLGRPDWEKSVDVRMNDGLRAIFNRLKYFLSPAGKKILDVGCGHGDMLHEIEDFGLAKEIVGLEPDSDWGKCARARTDPRLTLVITGVGESMPFDDEYFDIVFCNQVVEHVQYLELFLADLLRVCKTGGKIYLTAPNYIVPFENHYKVWFLPWFPKKMSAWILRSMGRDPAYLLYNISFINPFRISKILERYGIRENTNVIQKVINSPELISSTKIRKIVSLLNWIHFPSSLIYLLSPTFEMVITKTC